MTTAVLSRYDIEVSDVEYVRHGNKPLLARVYKPRGTGPFPLIVDLHLFEGVGEAFITNNSHSPAALEAIDKIIDFVHREIR